LPWLGVLLGLTGQHQFCTSDNGKGKVAPLRVCYSLLSHARGGIEELSTHLSVGASAHVTCLGSEVEKGFMRTEIGHELVDPKAKINLVKLNNFSINKLINLLIFLFIEI
jgi:hypothetical protein